MVRVSLPCTDSQYVVADYLFTMLRTAKGLFTPAIREVFYGDQKRIPETPALTVAASEKRRALVGAPRRVENTFHVFINLFVFNVRDVALNHREADQLAEAVEAKIHEDVALGGLVIHSMVMLNESGFLNRDNSQFRGNRLVVEATSRTLLPMSPDYNQ